MEDRLEIMQPESYVLKTQSIHQDESNNVEPNPIDVEGGSAGAVAAKEAPQASEVGLKLASCCMSFFFAGCNDGSLGALLPYMLQQYRVSTGLVIVIYIAAFAGWLFAAVTNFFLTQHLSLGLNLILGAVLQLLAHSLRVWAPPFALFAVTFFFAGLGAAYQDSHSNTFVSRVQSAHRWLGLLHAMYGCGLLVSPFVATPIASAFQPSKWYLFYYFPLGVGVINLTLVSRAFCDVMALRHAPIHHAKGSINSDRTPNQQQTATSGAKATLRLRSMWMLSLFYFFYLGTVLTASGWVVEYLVQVRGGALKAVGYVPAGISGGIFIGRLLLAEPTYRFGERRMVLCYCGIALALQLVFWLVPNIIVAAVAVSCMSLITAPLFATGVSVGSKLFPQQLQSSALGMVFVLGQAGGAFFPSITGLIATKAGVQTLQPILVGLIVMMGISWSMIPKVPKHSQ